MEEELARIVDVSRIRNARMSVTGALLFTGVRFAQCIEGPETGVAAIRQSIASDTRHAAVTTLMEGPIAQRRFSDWSLAYAGPSPSVRTAINRAMREAGPVAGGGGAALRDLLGELASQP